MCLPDSDAKKLTSLPGADRLVHVFAAFKGDEYMQTGALTEARSKFKVPGSAALAGRKTSEQHDCSRLTAHYLCIGMRWPGRPG